MKQRFGIDGQFPIDRYVTGLTSFTVPDSDHEHDANGNYASVADCDNPVFSTNLPAAATGTSVTSRRDRARRARCSSPSSALFRTRRSR